MATTRTSPPTERVIAVLEFLAAHPGEAFGLSDLAREADLSKPTCLGIVSTLAEHGYLAFDDSHKTYQLGAGLIRIGARASSSTNAAAVAARVLAPIAAEYDTVCSASAVLDGEIALLAAVGRNAPRPGHRYPFAPPVGLMYVVWDGDASVDAWLERPATLPMQLDRGRLRALVGECRDRGYLVEAMSANGRKLHTLLAGVAAYQLPDEVRALVGEVAAGLGERIYLEVELATQSDLAVSLIAVPTYDSQTRQELVLAMDVAATLTRGQIAGRAHAMIEAARAVTDAVSGQYPQGKGQS
jgi:DNA-binding IclR family transcriptional regulator